MRFKISLLLLILGLCLSLSAVAKQHKDDFLNSMLLSKEYTEQDQAEKASKDALNKLQQKQKKIDLQDNRKLRDIIKKQKKENKQTTVTPAPTKQDIKHISRLHIAPFGLLWGETFEEMASSGVILTRTEEKDYVNCFIATQLPKPLKDMRYVVVTFGEENRLWRIISYGQFIKDTPDGALTVKEYKRFYDLLDKKYGNTEQIYVPKITQVTKTIELGNGKTKQEIENVEEPIGNPNFLEQLQSGNADLYATFYNNEVGAVLSVNVDGNGNSYLILEYKNLKIFQQQQNKTLDAL